MNIVSVPGYFLHALTELHVAEIKGAQNNPKIVGYWSEAHASIKPDGSVFPHDDETSWCAAFVGAMLFRDGVEGSRSGLAKSYATWGDEWTGSGLSAIVVLNRAPLADGRPAPFYLGHVGFCAGMTKDAVRVLGGNQHDRVSIASFPRTRVMTIRQPKGVKLPTSGFTLPVSAVDPAVV